MTCSIEHGVVQPRVGGQLSKCRRVGSERLLPRPKEGHKRGVKSHVGYGHDRACVLRTKCCTASLKTFNCLASPSPPSLPNHPPPSRLRTFYTLLDFRLYHPLLCHQQPHSLPSPSVTIMFDSRALKLFTAFAIIATSVSAQSHTNEQSEARISGVHQRLFDCTFSFLTYNFPSDPNAECTTYSYPPVAQNIANFPTIWQPALTLVSSDSAGLALWNQISPGVPNIAPKGQLNGSTINETYDVAGDPDCCESHFVLSSATRRRGKRALYMGHVPSDMPHSRDFAQFAWRPSKPCLHLFLHI